MQPPENTNHQLLNDLEALRQQVAELQMGESERKRMEEVLRESEARLNAFFAASPVGLVIFDDELRYTHINEVLAKINGVPAVEHVGKPIRTVLPARLVAKIEPVLEKALRRGESTPNVEVSGEVPSEPGVERAWLASYFPIHDAHGNPNGVGVCVMEITERKRAEERIRLALKEKEVLLKEIHHRVRNNLQVVSSLLSLQARKVQKKIPEMFFQCVECQHRIQAMALIHEKLYQSQDLTTVNFAEYAQSLATKLVQSHKVHPDVVTLKFGVEDAALDIDTAIPCALILNELVSNALQHAFPAGRPGTIEIQFRSELEGYQLRVSDDGVGLPKGLVLQEADTLGLTLINALVSQLQGTVEEEEGVGTSFKISFPIAKAQQVKAS